MNEPFVQIRGGAATPLPRRQSVPPPPPPAPAQQGGGGGGNGGGGGMPHPIPPAQAQNMAAPMPSVPLHAIPPDLRGRPAHQVSDIRNERMTEGDARESLTQYKVIRFEKSSTHNEFDADGKPVKPTWARCEIIDENDIEQMEARKRIKVLEKERSKDDKPITITERKSSLPTYLKTQLERQQIDLQRHDDPRFTHTLVQIEDLTKPYEESKSKKSDSKDSKDNKKKDKKEGDTKRSSTDKKDHSRVKIKERFGVRAYFKRSPSQEQDCKALFFQLLAEKQQREHFQREHHRMMMHHQHQQHVAAMQPQPQPAVNQQPPGVRDVQIVQNPIKKDKGGPRSFHSSDDSGSDGWSSSEDEFQTPLSSIGSRASKVYKTRRREKKHHKDKAKYYNVDNTPRAVPVAENLYVVTTGSRGITPITPLSPQPRLPPVSMRYWDSEEQYDLERRDRQEEPRRRAIEPAYTHRPPLERRGSYARMSPLETRRERFDDLDYERNYRDNMARLDRFEMEEEERERERERQRDRRLSDAALDRAYYDRPRPHRLVVRAEGLYDHEPEYHAPYIRTRRSSYLDQEERAEDYIERRSSEFDTHPFAPRVRRRVYDDRPPA